jgi:hypothetical protein
VDIILIVWSMKLFNTVNETWLFDLLILISLLNWAQFPSKMGLYMGITCTWVHRKTKRCSNRWMRKEWHARMERSPATFLKKKVRESTPDHQQ